MTRLRRALVVLLWPVAAVVVALQLVAFGLWLWWRAIFGTWR